MAGNRSFGEQLSYWWDESLKRHVVIRKDEKSPVDLPLLVVIIAAIVAPWLAAGAVVVALVMGFRIEMTRPDSDATDLAEMPAAPEGDLTGKPPFPPTPPSPSESLSPQPGEAALPDQPLDMTSETPGPGDPTDEMPPQP